MQIVPKGAKSQKEFNFFSSVKGYFIRENSTKRCSIWKRKQVSNLRTTFERKRYQKTQLSYLNVIFSKLFNSVLLCVTDCSVLNRSEHCRGYIYIISLKINRSTYRKDNSTIPVNHEPSINVPTWYLERDHKAFWSTSNDLYQVNKYFHNFVWIVATDIQI